MKKVILLTALILNSGSAIVASESASWASWSGTTGTFVQNGNTIPVIYSGQYNWIDYTAVIFNDVPTSFTNSIVTNTPGNNGTIASGGGHWGGGTLLQTGNSVTGYEGDGLLQFIGTYNDIAFTTPNYEYYYGTTVRDPVSEIPEPEVYVMLLMGLGWLGFSACCRKYAAI